MTTPAGQPDEHDDSPDDGDEVELPPDAVVELTPEARAMWKQFIADCSAIAGRPVQPGEISAILRRMRQELGVEELDFTQAAITKRLNDLLQQFGNS